MDIAVLGLAALTTPHICPGRTENREKQAPDRILWHQEIP